MQEEVWAERILGVRQMLAPSRATAGKAAVVASENAPRSGEQGPEDARQNNANRGCELVGTACFAVAYSLLGAMRSGSALGFAAGRTDIGGMLVKTC